MNKSDLNEDVDARILLPIQFRNNWIATPKDFPYQVFLVGAMFGGMLTLMAIALIFELRDLWTWGGLLLLLIWLQSFLPWLGKKEEVVFEEYLSRSGEERNPGEDS
ncbi:MAG: hypothetical protein AAEJ04_05875 [Planctomycetota bacterium]